MSDTSGAQGDELQQAVDEVDRPRGGSSDREQVSNESDPDDDPDDDT